MISAVKDYEQIESGAALRRIDAPSGPCIPGQLRLFVNVHEQLFPCERVSERSPAMCIGTLDDGFNLENAQKILNVGKLTEESCKIAGASGIAPFAPKGGRWLRATVGRGEAVPLQKRPGQARTISFVSISS